MLENRDYLDDGQALMAAKLSWDKRGNILHEQSAGFESEHENLTKGLVPSFPLVLCHQLGTYIPHYGLKLCSRIFDYYDTRRQAVLPLGSDFAGAEIKMYERGKGAFIHFTAIKGSTSANPDKTSTILLYNYLIYVLERTPKLQTGVLWGTITLAIDHYLDLLKNAASRGLIATGGMTWNTLIGKSMAYATRRLSEEWVSFPPEMTAGEMTESEKWAGNLEARVSEQVIDTYRKLKEIRMIMEVGS